MDKLKSLWHLAIEQGLSKLATLLAEDIQSREREETLQQYAT